MFILKIKRKSLKLRFTFIGMTVKIYSFVGCGRHAKNIEKILKMK